MDDRLNNEVLKSSVSLKQEIKYNEIIDFIRILYTVFTLFTHKRNYFRFWYCFCNIIDITKNLIRWLRFKSVPSFGR